MGEKPLDLRIQKTYGSLIQAFLKLLEEKTFESITVNEICDRAMVRRATFYKHFGDKYEFFSFMVHYTWDTFFRQSLPDQSTPSGIEPYMSIIKNMLDFMDENDRLVQSMLKSNVLPVLIEIVSEQVARELKQQICEDEKKGIPPLLPADLLAQAYTGALMSTARWWVHHRDQISKEEILNQMTKLICRLYFGTEEYM